MNSTELPPVLGKALAKIERLLERQADAMERQAEMTFLLLSAEQQAAILVKDEERRQRAMKARGVVDVRRPAPKM